LGVIVSLQTNGMSVVFRVIHYFLILPGLSILSLLSFSLLPRFLSPLPSGRRGDRR
jgi:phosphoglycerol transferase MdoB-like AlkP superfamily enzyme